MLFSSIDIKDKNKYEQFWNITPEKSIDYTFINLWGWREYFGLQWHFTDKLCWLKPTPNFFNNLPHDIPTFWAPMGQWQDVDWQHEALLNHLNQEQAKTIRLIRVPKSLALHLQETLPHKVTLEECRGQWEYIYSSKDLATLSGNRYHRKRNHVNSFTKKYGTPDYRCINSNIIEDVLALQDEWCRWHECSKSMALKAENEAINHVLSHWQAFPELLGGALYVADKLVAFSVGEILHWPKGQSTLAVHYEKGHSDYRGVYQSMNTLFVQHAGQNTDFVNRAQDLDEEGLRHAKSSYLPVDFLHKYTVTIDFI